MTGKPDSWPKCPWCETIVDGLYCPCCGAEAFRGGPVRSCPHSADTLVYRLRKRAEIRRQNTERKSVQEGKPDRIADILEEAAAYIEKLEKKDV